MFSRSSIDSLLSDGYICRLVAGGAVSKVDPDSTGLNPAWRKALASVTFGIGWAEGTSSTEIKQLRAELAGKLESISALAPESGSYFNEVSVLFQ